MVVLTTDNISRLKPSACAICGHSEGLLVEKAGVGLVCFYDHPGRPVLAVEDDGPLMGHDPLADPATSRELRAGTPHHGANFDAMRSVRAANPAAFRKSESQRPLYGDVHEYVGDPLPTFRAMDFDRIEALGRQLDGDGFRVVPGASVAAPVPDLGVGLPIRAR